MSDISIENFLHARLDELDESDDGVVRVLTGTMREIIDWHKNWPVLVEGPTNRFETVYDPSDPESYVSKMTAQIAWMTREKYKAQFGTEAPTTPVLLMMARMFSDHPDFNEEWRA